jgi:hypothetical protein
MSVDAMSSRMTLNTVCAAVFALFAGTFGKIGRENVNPPSSAIQGAHGPGAAVSSA